MPRSRKVYGTNGRVIALSSPKESKGAEGDAIQWTALKHLWKGDVRGRYTYQIVRFPLDKTIALSYHQVPGGDSVFLSRHKTVSAAKKAALSHLELSRRQKERRRSRANPSVMKVRIRPRTHGRLTTRAREAVKKLFNEARDLGRHLPEFHASRSPRPLPRRSSKVAEYLLPGIDVRPQKAYTGRPLSRMVVGSLISPNRVIDVGTHRKPEKASKESKGKKLTIQELQAKGVKLGLKPAPYSEKSLTDGDHLNLQPFKGGWIVTYRGEHFGSTKRGKHGWDRGRFDYSGYKKEGFDKAESLLDEYYAAGGK